MEKLQALLKNVWVEKCGGSWGSSIVLAKKTHQEHIQNIDDFIWIMCVSYRKLNGITKPFYLTTPLCYDTISTTSTDQIFITSLDTR